MLKFQLSEMWHWDCNATLSVASNSQIDILIQHGVIIWKDLKLFLKIEQIQH